MIGLIQTLRSSIGKKMLTTHSHDIVDLMLVDHLVSEDGKIEKPFMEKYVR